MGFPIHIEQTYWYNKYRTAHCVLHGITGRIFYIVMYFYISWMKVFRIIPEFRISNSEFECWILHVTIAFWFSFSLSKGIWPLNLEFLVFWRHTASLISDFLKFRILKILNFHPWYLKVVLILANSADPDEMQHYAAFHLGLHCLPSYHHNQIFY